ncbi:hypothetical protein U1Q18_014781 [Sarracenia purpurea var. burkii]
MCFVGSVRVLWSLRDLLNMDCCGAKQLCSYGVIRWLCFFDLASFSIRVFVPRCGQMLDSAPTSQVSPWAVPSTCYMQPLSIVSTFHGVSWLWLEMQKMNMEGKRANPILVASLLAAAAQLAIVGPGSEIHAYVLRHRFESEIMVSSALIDMYSKCGFLGLGIKVFEVMPERNTIYYNLVISSLGLYGLASETFKLFKEMLKMGFRPDESTFLGMRRADLSGTV